MCTFFFPLPPSVLGLSERSGYQTAFMSHNSIFFPTSSVNIPWSTGGKEDTDYHYAFEKVVMPIAKEFAPEIVLGRCPLLHMTYLLIRF